jgi:hypothetical protein
MVNGVWSLSIGRVGQHGHFGSRGWIDLLQRGEFAKQRHSGVCAGGNWYNNTGTNSLVNTGTLNKTTTNSFTISVPMQQQNATVNVQAAR